MIVATVPPVYGIETLHQILPRHLLPLQQYLPFTVLKLRLDSVPNLSDMVATVLTVYGMHRRVRDSRGAKRR